MRSFGFVAIFVRLARHNLSLDKNKKTNKLVLHLCIYVLHYSYDFPTKFPHYIHKYQ